MIMEMPAHGSIRGFSFKIFTYIHNRLALKINRFSEETDIIILEPKERLPWFKKLPKINHSKQL